MALIDEAAVKELVAFRSPDAPVVSVYLDVDGRRQVLRKDVERQFEHLVREAQDRPGSEAGGGAPARRQASRVSAHRTAGPASRWVGSWCSFCVVY